MNTRFSHTEHFPGIYHITDSMGVQFTLIIPAGSAQALLFDTGYGLFDPKPYLASLLWEHGLDLRALSVLLSHAHHDHTLGARWFDAFYIHHADRAALKVYTTEHTRRRVLAQAQEKGVLPADFDPAAFFQTDYPSRVKEGLPSVAGIDIHHIPGHTQGSLVLYIREHRLLLSADNWNPTTWLFFPEALAATDYAENMRRLLALDFDYVLCSHAKNRLNGARLRQFINGLTAETFAGASPVQTPYPEIRTLLCHPEPGTDFVFRG
jgi:glyoxylase-like metal-dependent hydrolase (beta-lactamase superfamily II)